MVYIHIVCSAIRIVYSDREQHCSRPHIWQSLIFAKGYSPCLCRGSTEWMEWIAQWKELQLKRLLNHHQLYAAATAAARRKQRTTSNPERLLRKHRLGNSPPKGFSLVTISHTDSTTHAHFVHALQVMGDNAFWTKTRTRRRGTARANAKARTGFMPATMSGSYLHSGCKSRVQKECDKVLGQFLVL